MSLSAALAPGRRQGLRLAELDGHGLDRRLAVRADLPERLERRLAIAARLAQASRAHGAHEKGGIDLCAADRAVQLTPREALLHRLDLELALAHVLEVLGRTEEHVDDRADERHEAEQRRHPDEPRVLDSPPRVLVDRERDREPEDDDDEQ